MKRKYLLEITKWLLCLLVIVIGGMQVVAQSESVISILNFKDLTLPDHLNERDPIQRSDLDPLSCKEVGTLLDAKMGSSAIVELLKSRRTTCNPGAEELASFKAKGASDRLAVAISEHVLRPNETLTLFIVMTFKDYKVDRAKGEEFLHLYIDQSPKRPIRVVDSLNKVFSQKWALDKTTTYSDGLLTKSQREAGVVVPIKSKAYGKRELQFFLHRSGVVLDPSAFGKIEGMQRLSLEYPKFSRRSICTVELDFTPGKVLTDRWQITAGSIECDWG